MNPYAIPPLKKPKQAVIDTIQQQEARHKGLVAAIEPESGEYFLGKRTITAVEKGRRKYPEAVFYCIRIGYDAVYQQRGGFRKLMDFDFQIRQSPASACHSEGILFSSGQQLQCVKRFLLNDRIKTARSAVSNLIVTKLIS